MKSDNEESSRAAMSREYAYLLLSIAAVVVALLSTSLLCVSLPYAYSHSASLERKMQRDASFCKVSLRTDENTTDFLEIRGQCVAIICHGFSIQMSESSGNIRNCE
jgi:hypothetical protein